MKAIAAPIDLAALPRELAGKWVLVRIAGGRQQVLGSGDDPDEATRGQELADPNLLLTQVPRECTVHVVSQDC